MDRTKLPKSPLLSSTTEAWVTTVLGNMDDFLIDHAGCERKAASVCLSFIARHSDYPCLTEPLTALAREELEHFASVYRLIQGRGLILGCDEKDLYAVQLLSAMRHDRFERLLDRLIVSGLIEARSHERLQLLSDHLVDVELKQFYQALARAEAGHYRVFTRIAENIFAKEQVDRAIERLAKIESEVILSLPLRPTIH